MSIKETKMRQAFIRKIHAGAQPKKPPHFTYFRLELLTEKGGIYSLTPKAIRHFIDNDSVADSIECYAEAERKKAESFPFNS